MTTVKSVAHVSPAKEHRLHASRDRPAIGRVVVVAVVIAIVAVAGIAVALTQNSGPSNSASSSSSTVSAPTASSTNTSSTSSIASSAQASSSATTTPLVIQMALGPSTRIIPPGIIGNFTLSLTATGGSNESVYTVGTSLPSGFTADVAPQSVSIARSTVYAPEPANVSVSLKVANSVPSGTYQIGFHVAGPGGSFNETFPVDVSTTTVLMSNVEFLPGNLTVKAGTTVTWVNLDGYGVLPNDAGVHNVVLTSLNMTSPSLSQYGKFSLQFNQTGVYSYYCAFHPYMKGVITVTP
jgi:plastocyanin